MGTFKKSASLVLIIVMILTMIPATAFATVSVSGNIITMDVTDKNTKLNEKTYKDSVSSCNSSNNEVVSVDKVTVKKHTFFNDVQYYLNPNKPGKATITLDPGILKKNETYTVIVTGSCKVTYKDGPTVISTADSPAGTQYQIDSSIKPERLSDDTYSYEFLGWSTKQMEPSEETIPTIGTQMEVNQDTTLYAVWKKVRNIVIADFYDSKNNLFDSKKIELDKDGAEISLGNAVPATMSGKVFSYATMDSITDLKISVTDLRMYDYRIGHYKVPSCYATIEWPEKKGLIWILKQLNDLFNIGLKSLDSGKTWLPIDGRHIKCYYTDAPITSYMITATAGAGGTISGEVNVPANSKPTYTITPNKGYQIADVKVDGISVGIISSYTFDPVTTTHTIEATFAEIQPFTVVGTIDHGTVDGGTNTKTQPVEPGTDAPEMVFEAAEGYKITGVTVNDKTPDDFATGQTIYKYTAKAVAAGVNINVTTTIDKKTVTGNIDHGTVDDKDLTNNQPVDYGTDAKEMVFVAENGYKITGVTINNKTPDDFVAGDTTFKYTAKEVKADVTINVTTIKKAIPLELTGETATYDNKPHGIVVHNEDQYQELKFSLDDKAYTDYIPWFGDAGEYKVFVKGLNQGSEDATGSAIVLINKAKLTITADSASKTFNGTALTDNGWQDTAPKGLVGQDTVLYVSVTGSAIDVGTQPNVASQAIIGRPHMPPVPTLTTMAVESKMPPRVLPTEQELAAIRSDLAKAIASYKPNNELSLQQVIDQIIGRYYQDVTSNYTIGYDKGALTIISATTGTTGTNGTTENTTTSNTGRHNRGSGGTSTTTITDQQVPLAGTPELNKVDHFNYMNGYQDGTIKPLNNITREEVASIFYRMLTDASRKIFDTQTQDFSDIKADRWSVGAIATLANAGIITGNSDGTFAASKPITRAEFAVVASRFDTLEENTDGISFSDISGNWAEKYIKSAVKKGWITGYSDGTFKPNQYITRAEAMALINRVLDRRVDAAGLVDGYKTFSDVQPSDWYYYQVIEATNNHDYAQRKSMSDMETWTKIKEDKTWAK